MTARLSEYQAAQAPLEELAQLQLPLWLPGISPRPEGVVVVMDGFNYTLEARLETRGEQDGSVFLQGRTGSRLAQWADGMLAALRPCWSEPVQTAG